MFLLFSISRRGPLCAGSGILGLIDEAPDSLLLVHASPSRHGGFYIVEVDLAVANRWGMKAAWVVEDNAEANVKHTSKSARERER